MAGPSPTIRVRVGTEERVLSGPLAQAVVRLVALAPTLAAHDNWQVQCDVQGQAVHVRATTTLRPPAGHVVQSG